MTNQKHEYIGAVLVTIALFKNISIAFWQRYFNVHSSRVT